MLTVVQDDQCPMMAQNLDDTAKCGHTYSWGDSQRLGDQLLDTLFVLRRRQFDQPDAIVILGEDFCCHLEGN